MLLMVTNRGAETILYVGGPTNQNKCCSKSGGRPLDFKVGGTYPPCQPLVQRS